MSEVIAVSSRTSIRLTAMCPQLLVSELARSIDFYTNILGFEVDFRYEDFYAGVTRDGQCIHLKAADPMPDKRRHRRENEHLDISFGVAGLESLFRELTIAGVGVTQPLREMPYGREFYVADPDGYILGFLEVANQSP